MLKIVPIGEWMQLQYTTWMPSRIEHKVCKVKYTEFMSFHGTLWQITSLRLKGLLLCCIGCIVLWEVENSLRTDSTWWMDSYSVVYRYFSEWIFLDCAIYQWLCCWLCYYNLTRFCMYDEFWAMNGEWGMGNGRDCMYGVRSLYLGLECIYLLEYLSTIHLSFEPKMQSLTAIINEAFHTQIHR